MKVPPLPVIKHAKVRYGVSSSGKEQVRNMELLRESTSNMSRRLHVLWSE